MSLPLLEGISGMRDTCELQSYRVRSVLGEGGLSCFPVFPKDQDDGGGI